MYPGSVEICPVYAAARYSYHLCVYTHHPRFLPLYWWLGNEDNGMHVRILLMLVAPYITWHRHVTNRPAADAMSRQKAGASSNVEMTPLCRSDDQRTQILLFVARGEQGKVKSRFVVTAELTHQGSCFTWYFRDGVQKKKKEKGSKTKSVRMPWPW